MRLLAKVSEYPAGDWGRSARRLRNFEHFNLFRELAMGNRPQEQRAPDDRTQDAVDEAVEDTFPASDAPAMGGTTRIELLDETRPLGK